MATRGHGSRPAASAIVRERVRSLPGRYRHASTNGLAAEWELQVGDQTFTVAVSDHACSVREGPSGAPEATIRAEPETWLAMDEGRLAGIDAFFQRSLRVGGNIDLAVRVQTMFRPYRRERRRSDLDQVEIDADGLLLSAYVAGEGPTLLLLHGLGGSKISWLPVLGPLAERYRLIVPDLPGHGESQKPAAEYSPRFYARVVRRLMDEMGVDRAVLAGNSMGGRVSLELALRSPGRVEALVLLAPAVPGLRWRYLMNFTRIVPTEFTAVPFPLRARWMERMMRRMFARPSEMAPETFSAAAEEFIRVYRASAARMAFFASMRHIVTERPEPFWAGVRRVEQPALVVLGEEDRVVAPRLGSRLAEQLPDARVVRLAEVGHVPQFEAAPETLRAMLEFLDDRGYG